MRITTISAENILPIKQVKIENLDSVVIIAGANGSGKSRLKQSIIQTFQSPQSPQLNLTIKSTRPEEEGRWRQDTIELIKNENNPLFHQYMESRTRGGSYAGTVIQIDSQRNIQNVNYGNPLDLSSTDPDEEEIPITWYFGDFGSRWNQVVRKIHQKVANWDTNLAKKMKENQTLTGQQILQNLPDPSIPYQELFSKLLPGKTLEKIDPKNLREFYYKNDDGSVLPFTALSSGEQEVVKITFDLLWKKIRHCVFLIDEPELHLHPTLTFRLIETLKEMGDSTNQFIFFTHSADLISTYFSTGNVYFIDASFSGGNQAHRLSDLQHSHSQLTKVMGEHLGLFAVGKKLVFVEGEQSSKDRLTYHAIAQKYYPEFQVTPVGTVTHIMNLQNFVDEISKSIFGINFYMIRDRDGVPTKIIDSLEKVGRIRFLKKRCLENYFLDSEILAKVGEQFYIEMSDFKNPKKINDLLHNIALEMRNLNILKRMKDYTSDLFHVGTPTVKNVLAKQPEDIISQFTGEIESEVHKLQLDIETLQKNKVFDSFVHEVDADLTSGNWINTFSGKEIYAKYCSTIKVEEMRVTEAYTQLALTHKPAVFADIKQFFEDFNS